jgi:hypothetical protein
VGGNRSTATGTGAGGWKKVAEAAAVSRSAISSMEEENGSSGSPLFDIFRRKISLGPKIFFSCNILCFMLLSIAI